VYGYIAFGDGHERQRPDDIARAQELLKKGNNLSDDPLLDTTNL